MASLPCTENDVGWDVYYAKLEQYRSKHGHTKVPKNYENDKELARWVNEQRKQYKMYASMDSDLTPAQYRKLEAIDFEMSNGNPRHLKWKFRYDQLKEFVEKHGHSQVPIGWEENIKLANWVSTQRQEYKNIGKGRTTQLDDERIRLLTDIGFAWEVQRGGKRRNKDLLRLAVAKKKPKRKESKKDSAIPAGKVMLGGEDGAPVDFSRKHPANMDPMQSQSGGLGERPQHQTAMHHHLHIQRQRQQQQMLFQYHLQQRHQQEQRREAPRQQDERSEQEEENDQQHLHSFTAAVPGHDGWQPPSQQVLVPLHTVNGTAFPAMGVPPPGGIQRGREMPPGMPGMMGHPMPANMPRMNQFPMAAAIPGMIPNPMFAMAPGMAQQPAEKLTPLQAALAASNNRSAYDPPRRLQHQNARSQREVTVHIEQPPRRKKEDP